jgi:hypothetical protein
LTQPSLMNHTRPSLIPALLPAAVATAASSYKINLPTDLVAGDVPLKAGAYIVTLEGKEAVFTKGKTVIRVPIIVDKNEKKFPETGLETSGSQIQSIDLGGTNIIVKFRASH